MSKLITLFFLILLLCLPSYSQTDSDRRDVKFVRDNFVSKIDTNDLDVTVYDLGNVPEPKQLYRNTVRLQIEMQVFTIKCKVKKIIKEKDGDYHIIVEDLIHTGSTMIIEVVNPSEVGTKFYSQIKKVRKFLLNNHLLMVNKTIIVSGVAFFDIKHNQKGIAPNGIELHPVLKLNFAK